MMNNGNWPLVSLGEIIKISADRVPVSVDQEYPNFGIYSFGRGLFVKPPIQGASTSAPVLFRAKTNQFVYSRLFAFEGAYGTVPEELDGYFVSNEFPLFDCDPTRLLPGYLGWYFRNPRVWPDVARLTTGMGNRRQRIQPTSLFSYTIPLPPLEDQRRIVDRIDRVISRLEETVNLRHRLKSATEALAASLHHRLSKNRRIRMGRLVELDEQRVAVEATTSYPQIGIRGFGGGLFAKPPVAGAETTYRHFNRLQAGMLVLSQVKGWEGAIAVCKPDLVGYYASPEYRTFRCINSECDPDYLDMVVRSPWFRTLLQEATHGQGARRERTRPERFIEIVLSMPEIGDQRRAVKILSKLNSLEPLERKASEIQDAMLPSILDRAFKGGL